MSQEGDELPAPSTPRSEGFRQLSVEGWRQFESVDLLFHERLTVLTGANASGKSTLLSLLGRHFNWGRSYLSTGGLRVRRNKRSHKPSPINPSWDQIGQLTYASGASAFISAPQPENPQSVAYDIQMSIQPQVPGLYLSSHRALSWYSPVTEIPIGHKSAAQMLGDYTNGLRIRTIGQQMHMPKSPMQILKEALISCAAFGEGNSSLTPDAEKYAIWNGFQDVLGKLVPKSLGFERLRINGADVLLDTFTGDFPIDEASGGLTAIIELAWQIFLQSHNETSFTVILDEPENHLHPTLQRRVLPDLLNAFPSAQFIVATHSPFVVTAVNDSSVYVLDYDEGEPGSRVRSRLLGQVNKAGSADQTLRRVLGVESSIPLWAESSLDEIISRHLSAGLARSNLLSLRSELIERGLADELPRAIEALQSLSETE